MQSQGRITVSAGACRKIKTKEEKVTGGGFEPATLASAVGLLCPAITDTMQKVPGGRWQRVAIQ